MLWRNVTEKQEVLTQDWRVAEHTTPKCATLACGLFWVEGIQGPADSERAFYLPLNCLKDFG